MDAVDYHISCNNRPNKKVLLKTTSVMIEYILIKEVNDLPEHAHELGALLSSRRAHIILNLIPYNPTDVIHKYEPPTTESISTFFQICMSDKYRIYTRVRQEMGQDIAGACGQLALVRKSDNSDVKSTKSAVLTDVEDHSGSNAGNRSSHIRKEKGISNILHQKLFQHTVGVSDILNNIASWSQQDETRPLWKTIFFPTAAAVLVGMISAAGYYGSFNVACFILRIRNNERFLCIRIRK